MISVKDLKYRAGNFQLQIDQWKLEKGEYHVLMGPPGSGKTALLECLCGLRAPEKGLIHVDGTNVTRLASRLRNIGYVPQDYALFPHLRVENNIMFGPLARGLGGGEAKNKALEMAKMLGIDHLLSSRLFGLSGGERQRVALARALAAQPKVLLLDEPVSALDMTTRHRVCMEIKRLHTRLGMTTVHVSHNLEEAFSVADRAAILDGGLLRQSGTLSTLMRKPRSGFVARFLGGENIFQGNVSSSPPNGGLVKSNGIQWNFRPGVNVTGQIFFLIRPEAVVITATDKKWKEGEKIALQGESIVEEVQDRGTHRRLILSGPPQLIVHLSPDSSFVPTSGKKCRYTIFEKDIHLLEEP